MIEPVCNLPSCGFRFPSLSASHYLWVHSCFAFPKVAGRLFPAVICLQLTYTVKVRLQKFNILAEFSPCSPFAGGGDAIVGFKATDPAAGTDSLRLAFEFS